MSLYERFRDPPREHSLRPFWFWNGELTPDEVRRQIDAMVEQGVYGAYAHCRSGLRPRYLSEEWWELIRAGVDQAQKVGFQFCVVDEYNWPSGDARDYTLRRYPSRVLERDERFGMRTLVPERGFRTGADYVVAGQRLPSGELDAESLRLTDSASDNGDAADAVWSFTLRDAVSFDGGLVDLMNADAVGTFVELVYAEYGRRLGPELGRTFRGFFCDHEGDIGYRLAWTGVLREAFQRAKGYDLVPLLPLLLEEGGPRTPIVRCDYFDVTADLYARNFFGQLADFCAECGLDVTGHVWEESLQAAASFQSDHFRVQRAFTTPGVDSLFEWGRKPRHFLEARSVAHFRRTGFVCENQGVQGAEDYLSLERVKRTTNAIAAWGVTLFVPHALNGNHDRIDFPEDWFEPQPWWPFFRHYADYARRLSFMNAGGQHVCEVLLYYPIESVWAHGDPCFLPEKWDYIFEGADNWNGPRVTWNNAADEVDLVYGEIIETLPAHQWDLDIIDDHYLREATIVDGRLRIAEESFGVLVLPPMTCMRLSAARRARELAEAGGLVVAVGRLPTDSMENGRDDPQLAHELDHVAAVRVQDVDELLALLEQRAHKDVRVVEGTSDGLLCAHRVKEGQHVFYCVNDSDRSRRNVVRLDASGRPEVWDPDGGGRRPAPASAAADGTDVCLELGPWQALYVVFGDGEPEAPTATRPSDREPVLVVPGPWRVTPALGETPACYARTALCGEEEGLALGWHRPELADRHWNEEWLSPEGFTLTDFWVVGHFDYHRHRGYNEPYPPELELDLDATYEGRGERRIRWRRYTSPDRFVDLDDACGDRLQHWGGMQFKTAYALTQVYSSAAQECELRLVGDSNAKAWLNGELVHDERDDHQGYLELRDAYGFRIPVRLQAGWNRLLLKVSQAMRYGGIFGFVARFCDAQGHPLPDLLCSATAEDERAQRQAGERWYRLRVPAGTKGLRLPAGAEHADLYLDGRPVERVDSEREATLALRLPAEDELRDFPVFELDAAERLLGPITPTGLAFYAGTLVYEATFDLPPGLEGRPLELDLGTVGVAARASLNDVHLGERAWRPFRFELGGAARTGANELRVEVANTRSSERARGPHQLALWSIPVRGPALLDQLDENGLHGPVRILAG